jgi:membrane protease YdiL (CAAX protease family)
MPGTEQFLEADVILPPLMTTTPSDGLPPSTPSDPDRYGSQRPADAGVPSAARATFSLAGTIISSVLVAMFAMSMLLLSPGTHIGSLERPEEDLERLVSREMDVRRALDTAPAWERALDRFFAGDEDSLAQSIRWYDDLSREVESPEVQLYRVILLAEAGRADRVSATIIPWQYQGEVMARMFEWVRAAYLGSPPASSLGERLLSEIEDDLSPGWFADILTARIAKGIGDQATAAAADGAILRRGVVFLERRRALAIAELVVLIAGLIFLIRYYIRYRTRPVHPPPISPTITPSRSPDAPSRVPFPWPGPAETPTGPDPVPQGRVSVAVGSGPSGVEIEAPLPERSRPSDLLLGTATLPAPWDFRDGYALFIRGVLGFLVVSGVISYFLPDPNPLSGVVTLLSGIPILWLTMRYLRQRGLSLGAVLGLRPPPDSARLSRTTVVLVALSILGELTIALIVSYFHLKTDWTDGLLEDLLWGSWIAVFGAAVDSIVWAALVEEVAFRGILYGTLRTKLSVGPAALLSAGCFAAVHGYGTLGLASVFWSGILWAVVYERTRSLWPAILAHGVNNLLVTAEFVWLFR